MKKFLGAVLAVALFVPTAFGSIIYGNPNGQVVITKYFDYQCPHCRTLTPVVDSVAAKNKDVKIISRVIPILSPESWYVARAAIAAKYQGRAKFNRFNEQLMAQRRFITPGLTLSLARNAGINIKQLKKDMASKKVTAEIRSNVKVSRQRGVHQIPVMFIAKSKTPGQYKRILGDASYSAIQNAVNSVR